MSTDPITSWEILILLFGVPCFLLAFIGLGINVYLVGRLDKIYNPDLYQNPPDANDFFPFPRFWRTGHYALGVAIKRSARKVFNGYDFKSRVNPYRLHCFIFAWCLILSGVLGTGLVICSFFRP